MANKNFNTQIRKKFDSGSNPIKRGGLNFKTPAQKSHEKSKKQFNPSDYNITSAGGTKKTLPDENSEKNMSDKDKANLQKAAKKRRQFNKRKNKKTEDRQPKQPIGKPRLKKEPLRKPEDKKPRINKLKDKLKKVGDMKVKDAAKVVGKAALATTPVGLAKNAADTFNKNFKFQSPIVSRKNRKFGGR